MGAGPSNQMGLPGWIPEDVHDYLVHTLFGQSIRALARAQGCEASTILRRVRRIESRRDDPLVDAALARLGTGRGMPPDAARPSMGAAEMIDQADIDIPTEAKIEREARRILRRMAEQGACLALAPGMDTAVVVRETADGGPTLRTAVVERDVAEAMALKDWIGGTAKGRIMRYRITASGRAALKRLVAREESKKAKATGLAFEEADAAYDASDALRRGARYSLAESPLAALARRRDKTGRAFLSDELVAAGERLREDFELSGTGGKPTQNWEDYVSGAAKPAAVSGRGGAEAARARVEQALAALGPGLGDVALRCCCFLEGLESAEQRMGWSARSGKIVLRIALQRLKLHYDAHADEWSPLIG